MKYKKILVAVDSTDDAEHVMSRAMLAAQKNSDVHLVTVVEPLSNVYGTLVWSPAIADTQDLEDALLKRSKKQLDELGQRHGLKADNVYVELGSAAPTIRKMAEKMSVDLIVIGTHGRHGIGLILGSTANSVLHGVCTDVLVIRLPSDNT